MTEHQQLVETINLLRNEVRELNIAIVGDKLRKVPGALDILETHRKEIFGDEDTRHIGLKQSHEICQTRLNSLEGDRTKVLAVASAVSTVVAVIWILLKAFFIK